MSSKSTTHIPNRNVVPALNNLDEFVAYMAALNETDETPAMKSAMESRAIGDMEYRLGRRVATQITVGYTRLANRRVYGAVTA